MIDTLEITWEDLQNLEELTSNTLFVLAPYLHRLLPNKKRLNEFYKEEKQDPSKNLFPKIKTAYDRYMKHMKFTEVMLTFMPREEIVRGKKTTVKGIKGGKDIIKSIKEFL